MQAREALAPRLLYVLTEDWYFLSHRLPMARAAVPAGLEVHVATNAAQDGDAIEREGFLGSQRRTHAGRGAPDAAGIAHLMSAVVACRRPRSSDPTSIPETEVAQCRREPGVTWFGQISPPCGGTLTSQYCRPMAKVCQKAYSRRLRVAP
jgi:hypothetical protein